MMFCPECRSLMFPKQGVMICRKCGHEMALDGKTETIRSEIKEQREIAIFEDELDTLPTTSIQCPNCANNRAYWVIRQTRAADEPPTRIYRCTECKHSWREY